MEDVTSLENMASLQLMLSNIENQLHHKYIQPVKQSIEDSRNFRRNFELSHPSIKKYRGKYSVENMAKAQQSRMVKKYRQQYMSFLIDNPTLIEQTPDKQSQLTFMRNSLNKTFDSKQHHKRANDTDDSKMSTFASSFKCNDFIRDQIRNVSVPLNPKNNPKSALPPIIHQKQTKIIIKSPYKKRAEAEKQEQAKQQAPKDSNQDIGKIKFMLLHAQESYANGLKKANQRKQFNAIVSGKYNKDDNAQLIEKTNFDQHQYSNIENTLLQGMLKKKEMTAGERGLIGRKNWENVLADLKNPKMKSQQGLSRETKKYYSVIIQELLSNNSEFEDLNSDQISHIH